MPRRQSRLPESVHCGPRRVRRGPGHARGAPRRRDAVPVGV